MKSQGDDHVSTGRLVGQDDMFTVYRAERTAAHNGDLPALSFRELLVLRLLDIELAFVEAAWPSFSGRVIVHSEDDSWEPVSEAWEAQWAAEGLDPRLETLPPAPIQIELALQYILRRVEPLSSEYWYIAEVQAIRAVLDAPSLDDALAAAHSLGALQEQAHLHDLHHDEVRRARAQAQGSRRGAKMRHGAKEGDTRARLEAMERLIEQNRTVSEAARLVARSKNGGEPGANRALYYRHHPPQK